MALKKHLLLIFTYLIVTSLMFAQSPTLNNGLIVNYQFEGNSNDSSPNAFHANGNAELTTDRFGNPNSAYHFNGINQYLDLPTNTELKPQLPATISFWASFEDLTIEKTFIFANDFTEDLNTGININLTSDGRVAVAVCDGGTPSTNSRRSKAATTPLKANTWYFILIVLNSNTDIDIFVNEYNSGSLCSNDGGTYSGTGSNLFYSSNPGSIGRNDVHTSQSPYYFQGKVDELKMWNRALTSDEILDICPSTKTTNSPPILTATGDQLYCPQNDINIVTDFNIENPDSAIINAIYIQISTGYINGSDRLVLTGSHPNITAQTFNVSEGKLVLEWTGSGSPNDNELINAVKNVVFQSTSPSTNERTFSININEANYLPSTGHYYEYIPNSGITWTAAKIEAEARDYYGLKGYLATITGAEEAQLCGEQSTGQGWIGGSDDETEGEWKWVTGPEAGQTFWFGLWNGNSIGADFQYTNWSSNEPNDWPDGSSIPKQENFAHVYDDGRWNDYPNFNSAITGYIVEYGGMPGDPVLNFSTSTRITVPKITNTTGDAICGTGNANLEAMSDSGKITWFSTPTSTAPIGEGENWTTPIISSTTTFYALASAEGCTEGIRTGVIAMVMEIPTITSITDNLICGNGSGTLNAIASDGVVNWYTTLTGGTSIFTGSNFTTPNLTETTTYYVDATDVGCTTLERKPVTLTVVHIDKPTTTDSIQYFCDTENASLNDLTLTGTDILWYASQTGGTPLNNSEILKNNTTYYASQTINTCESEERLSVEVILYETPTPLTDIPKIGTCDSDNFGNDTDGIEYFNLNDRKSSILNGKNSADYTIYYFSDVTLNNEITDITNYKNTVIGNPQTIYFKIENKNLIRCSVQGSFEIEVYPLPILLNPEITLEQCDDDESNDGFSVFNLNEANELISSNYENESFEFYRDTTYLDKIEDPIAYENPSVINSSVYVIIKTENNCEHYAKINLKVGATQLPNDFHLQYFSCENQPSNNQDGRVFFDFSDAEQKLIDTKPIFSSQEVRITFFESLENALSEINAIPDISNYENSDPWEQKIYIRIDSDDVNACLGLNHVITLNVEPLPIANPVTMERQCDDDQDGLFPFDISTIHETVINGQTDIIISYFDEAGNELPSPLPNPFLTKSQTITIKIENEISDISPSCFDETPLQFIVDDAPEIYPVFINSHCDDGDDPADGFSDFDTSTIESTLLGGQTNMQVYYFDADDNPLTSPLPNPFFTDTQEIKVVIENPLNTSCTVSSVLNFIVNPIPVFDVEPEQILCNNRPPTILEPIDPQGDYTYEWFNSEGDIIGIERSYPTFEGGYFTVIATSDLGCESAPRTIFVEESNVANIGLDDVIIVDDSDNNTITINDLDNNLGDDDYEYALNSEFGPFQDEPYFDNVPAGIHTLFVRDTDNCGTASLDLSVIGYPKFFTPNNDGYNDTWTILGISQGFYPISTLNIFDRFGKLLAQINPNYDGWNGIYNNEQLPSSDYWFSVELIDSKGKIRTKKGHFSLIRR